MAATLAEFISTSAQALRVVAAQGFADRMIVTGDSAQKDKCSRGKRNWPRWENAS